MTEAEITLAELFERALASHQAGNLVEAEVLYRAILDREQQHAAALNSLGVIAFQCGNPADAIPLIERALAIRPDYVDALMNRGTILAAQGQAREALADYGQALALRPGYAEALYNRGGVLQQLGRNEEALANYDQALAIKPEFAEVLNNRGNALAALNRLEEAVESYDRLLAIDPHNAEALNNRANALFSLKRPQEAVETYDRALALKPDHVEALCNRGNALCEMAQRQAALESYRRALAVKPDYPAARLALCMAQLPVIYVDEPEIAAQRAAYEEDLKALCRDFDCGSVPGDLSAAVGLHQPFYLAYQGHNDRDLQSLYGSLVCRIMAARFAPAALPAPPDPDEPVRVGVVSGFFSLHSNWKLRKGWFSQLDRRRFRLFGYHTGTDRDLETAHAAAIFDRFVHGPLAIQDWRRTILADAPHVLIYPNVGLDPASAALAAQRLAPAQCTSWGHPDTSGFPTIDYFLSSDLMEPPEGQDHYTEALIRLPNLSLFYEPFDVPPVPLSRPELGLRPTATVYWCGQSLFKYLPQHDQVFARIAKDAADCQFAFIEYQRGPEITALFKRRLARAFAALGLRAEDYCIFLPRMDFARFIAGFAQCDVMLDSIGWSGANTTFESLAHPLPIVTIIAPLMRGRHTMAILKMMGVTETIAATIDDYVSIAVRLARDPSWRKAVGAKMAANVHRVYRDSACIAALEQFLSAVARGERDFSGGKNGKPSSDPRGAPGGR